MFSKVYSGGIWGIDGYLVQVEADCSNGLPCFTMVGFLAAEVREAQERVRTALRNSGCALPPKKVTINLSPASRRKEGTGYDVPIAVAVLAAHGVINRGLLEESAFIGEMGLDGEVKPISGVLPLVLAFREAGLKYCFLPRQNVKEASAVGEIRIIGVDFIGELIRRMNEMDTVADTEDFDAVLREHIPVPDLDFADINGQTLLKRAAEVAAAGKHNLLLIGPAGCGKSMLARRLPTIMPAFSAEERLETSKIHSICGLLMNQGEGLLASRPYRNPHHTISVQGLAGGGRTPRPGEISLASGGILFLDELPEYKRGAIELLRQPMEERKVVISRVHGSCEFPANFLLVAALNPCPCGNYPNRERCACTDVQVRRYLHKISKPILDRIDICIEAAPLTYDEIRGGRSGETSDIIRRRVEEAGRIQRQRFAHREIHFNSEMKNRDIRQYCRLTRADSEFLRNVFERTEISVRAYHKILKVARTIADLCGEEQIRREHLCEAAGYRQLEQKYWSGQRYE